MRVRIVGDGAWGTALHKLIKENSHEVSFITRKDFTKVKRVSDRINTDAEVLILALPTQAIRSVLDKIDCLNSKIIVNCTKGIERRTHQLPFQIVSEKNVRREQYFTLIGPSFAEEVKAKMPTIVNLGHNSEDKYIDLVKSLFERDYFEVKVVHGIAALELAGAFKNLYAIACGITAGLGFGMNTRVKVILAGLEEMHDLMMKLKFRVEDETIPGILGDLILTCNSTESRNFTFGKLIVNLSVEEALAKINATVEGFYAADSVNYFEEKGNIRLLLAGMVARCIKIENKHILKQLVTDTIAKIPDSKI